jgi:hypothetical protein
MQRNKERLNDGRKKLQNIIATCQSIEERSLDPFLIDIKENVNSIRKYFPEWKIPDDLCLDAETLHHLAAIVKMQSEWVKHRSTSLYTDPFLLEEKLTKLSKEEIVDAFMKTWFPTIEQEQISLHSLKEALRYWENLLPMDERWGEESPNETAIGVTTKEELIQQKILRDKAFSQELEIFWQELKSKTREVNEKGRITYWDFISAETYDETIHRAFMTSFLITYGYATLEIYPLEEKMFIKPYEKPAVANTEKQLVSIPISVSLEEWKKWKKVQQD